MSKFLLIVLVIISVSDSAAREYFSGSIERDTRWIGDIYINGDVTVPQGIILSIESGSRIFFKPDTDAQSSGKDPERSELIINGVLLARGKSGQGSILFTPESEPALVNNWYGIIIKNMNEKSILENCIIEYGYKGLTCYGSAPLVKECSFRFNYYSGISCEVQSDAIVEECVILGNGFSGINCELASAPVVSRSIITQNNIGVISFSNSQPDLGHSIPQDDQSAGLNRIFNNFDYDIYNHSVYPLLAQNNYWNTSSMDEIRFRIYDYHENSSFGQVIFQPTYLNSSGRKKGHLKIFSRNPMEYGLQTSQMPNSGSRAF